MNKEALLRLADKLDGSGEYAKVGPVPEENFDMSVFWAAPDNSWSTYDRWAEGTENGTVLSCGYAACALGWAAADPYFQALGMRGGGGMFKQAAEVFGIGDDAPELFVPWEKPEHGPDPNTPQAVAKRLRQYVADGRRLLYDHWEAE